MNEKKYWQRGCYTVLLAFVGNFLLILGWYSQFPLLLRLPGTTAVVSFSAILCLFFGSCAVLSLLYRHIFSAHFFGGMIFFIAAWRMLEVVTNQKLGHFQFFQSLVPETIYSVHSMTEVGAFIFLILSLILILWNSENRIMYRIARIFFAQLIIVLALCGVIAQALPQESWPGLHFPHLYSSIILLFLGIALIMTCFFYDLIHKIALPKKFPPWISILLMSLTIGLCIDMLDKRKKIEEEIVNSKETLTQKQLIEKIQTSLGLNDTWTYSVFLGGLIVSLTMGELFNLWKMSQNNMLAMEDLSKKLKDAQFNLETSLQFAEIGTWKWDIIANKLDLDQQAQNLFGYKESFSGSFEDLLERTFPKDRNILDQAMRHPELNRKKSDAPTDVRVILPNGSFSYISIKGQPFVNEVGKFEKIYGSLWDVTEIRFAQQRLELSQHVARVLNDSTSLKEAATRILIILNKYFGSEVGVIWKWNPKTVALECAEILHMPEVQTPEFEEVNRHLIGKNLKIPNEVMATLRPISLENLDEFYPSSELQKSSSQHLQGVLAFPIFDKSAISGVVEIFKRSPYVSKIDEGMENLLTATGVSFGQFIKKIEAQQAQEQLIAI